MRPIVILVLTGLMSAARPARALDVDLAPGTGVGWQRIERTDASDRSLDGLAGSLDLRLFHPSGHGGGVRIAGVTELSLFGGRTDAAFVLDLPYAYRFVAPKRGWHVVPTLFAGPSLIRTSATYREECFLGCTNSPPPDLHAHDHLALGGVLGGSLDVHVGRAFVGVDLSARHVLAVSSSTVDGDDELLALLRVGATLGPAAGR